MESPALYTITATRPKVTRREVGATTASAAAWVDQLRAEGYPVAVRQDGVIVSYDELMRRDADEWADLRRKLGRASGTRSEKRKR